MKVAFLPAAALLLAEAAFVGAVAGTYSDQASVSANTFSIDTLDPPTGLTAGVYDDMLLIMWTSTVDTYASGYYVLRSTTTGGPYSSIATVTPSTEQYYYDWTATPGIRYYYVLQTYFQNWLSVYSNEANAARAGYTAWRSPTAQAAVTSSSGDNDGFESNPTYAFADDASYAEDVNSGTAASLDCLSLSRDRHWFYDYDITIPSGATINGIEVRLDAWADYATYNPRMCVQLSWDGGTTWTAGKTTADLTTSEQSRFLGTYQDTWGRTWSLTDFSNANFRLRITDVATTASRDLFLDWVAVKVHYTPP